MGRRTYYHRNKGIRWDLILFGLGAVLLIVYGCLQYKAIKDQEAYKKTIVRFEALKEYSVEVEPTEKTDGIQAEKAEEVDSVKISYQRLFEANEDMIGWLKIPGTEIDYPVMQTSNNEYYLDHNYNQEYDKNGSLFLDKDCDVVKRNTNLIIYGHHMKSGKMFGNLNKYSSESYYKEHSTIQFDSIYEKGTYQIMYVFRSRIYNEDEIVFKYYQFIDAASEKEFNSNMQEMAALSLYDTGVTASYGDELLTLSTCDNSEEDGRFVVVAKRIE